MVVLRPVLSEAGEDNVVGINLPVRLPTGYTPSAGLGWLFVVCLGLDSGSFVTTPLAPGVAPVVRSVEWSDGTDGVKWREGGSSQITWLSSIRRRA